VTHQAVYFLRELMFNLTRNVMMSIAAASTSTVSLLTFGISLIMVYNINNLATEITSQVEIRAFLSSTISNFEVKNLEEKIFEMPQVKSIEYISPDRALDKLEEDLNIELDISPEENPLPHGLVIKVTHPREIGNVADFVRGQDSVEEVKYGETILRSILAVSMFIKIIGYVLTVIMGSGALFTIMNTIRLTVIARRDEIRTMQLVGASGWFIRWPFMLEGIALGAIGAVLASLILSAAYFFTAGKIHEALPFTFPLVSGAVMARILFLLLFLVGSIMGFIGSYISVTGFLSEKK